MPTTTTGVSTPEKTPLDLALEAKAGVQKSMNDKRIEFLKTLGQFDQIGGRDDIKAAVLDLLPHFSEGLPLPFLQSIAPDAALKKALEELDAEGKLAPRKKRGDVVIKLKAD